MGTCGLCRLNVDTGAMTCGGEPDPCAMIMCPEVLCPEEGQCKRRGFYDCCVGADACTFDGCCGSQCSSDQDCADERECGRCQENTNGVRTCGGQ